MTTASSRPSASSASIPSPRTANPLISRRLVLWLAAFVLVIAAIVGIAWWFTPPQFSGVIIQSPRVADNFTLTASTGDPIRLSDLQGKIVILFFGYTYCPDICPTTLADLALMAEELGPRRMQNVQVVLVSVDPERDTPEQLAAYLRSHDERFLGMTGDVADIQRIATQFGIFFEKHDDTGLVDHSGSLTVIDRKGFVRMILPNGVGGKAMAEDIAYLLRRG